MDERLSVEEQATNYQTMRHIERVRNLLNKFIKILLERGEDHDQTKMEPPEVGLFSQYSPKLATCDYDSPEYKEYLNALAPALTHHYAKYRHHPDHFDRGLNDMTLVDLVEMFCDWKASAERQHNGNILKSVEKNAIRFKMSTQLREIFENTAKQMDE